MNILITGATGFIGKHLVPVFLEKGYHVTLLSRNPENNPWKDQVNMLTFDLAGKEDPAEIWKHFPSPPDRVVHLAWQGLPYFKALHHIEENIMPQYRFIKSCMEAGVGKITITGTCLEYGKQDGCLREDQEVYPDVAYGLAKDTVRRLMTILSREFACPWDWLRLFYCYGPDQSPKSLIPQLHAAIAQGDKEFLMSAGDQQRDFIPIKEMAQLIVKVVEQREGGGVLNIGSGKPKTVMQLIEEEIESLGASIKPKPGIYDYPDYEAHAFWGSREKLDAFLGGHC